MLEHEVMHHKTPSTSNQMIMKHQVMFVEVLTRPTIECRIMEFCGRIPDTLLFNKKDFIVIIMLSIAMTSVCSSSYHL